MFTATTTGIQSAHFPNNWIYFEFPRNQYYQASSAFVGQHVKNKNTETSKYLQKTVFT